MTAPLDMARMGKGGNIILDFDAEKKQSLPNIVHARRLRSE
jgi:hypothetical protein